MVRESTCISSMYFGAGLLMLQSSGYLSGAVRSIWTRAAASVIAVRCGSTFRFVFANLFLSLF